MVQIDILQVSSSVHIVGSLPHGQQGSLGRSCIWSHWGACTWTLYTTRPVLTVANKAYTSHPWDSTSLWARQGFPLSAPLDGFACVSSFPVLRSRENTNCHGDFKAPCLKYLTKLDKMDKIWPIWILFANIFGFSRPQLANSYDAGFIELATFFHWKTRSRLTTSQWIQHNNIQMNYNYYSSSTLTTQLAAVVLAVRAQKAGWCAKYSWGD